MNEDKLILFPNGESFKISVIRAIRILEATEADSFIGETKDRVVIDHTDQTVFYFESKQDAKQFAIELHDLINS